MHTRLICLVLLALVAVPKESAAQAQDLNLGAIYVCNEIVLRIRFPAGNQTILQRRQIVNERIIEAYRRQKVSPANVQARFVGGEWAVYAGSQLLITVDREHAQANGTTPRALAQIWAAKFRETMPRCQP